MLFNVSTTATAIAALAAVFGLIWIAGRGARIIGLAAKTTGGGRTVAVQEVVALDSRRRLYLVRCAERQVLLLTGGESDQVVGWLPSPDPQRGRETGQ